MPQCALSADDPRVEAVEVSCDGVDNDCDGRVDELAQVDENLCVTGKKGACAWSHRVCRDGAAVCPPPPPTHETWDGVDNDCDGVIDDVPQGFRTVSRARVLVPRYLWQENHDAVAGVRNALEGAGIPYDADQGPADFDEALERLDDYNLIVMPGYVAWSYHAFDDADLDALEAFVRRGGVLVWFRVVQGSSQARIYKLAGALSAKQRMDVTRLEVSPVAATLWLDTEQERRFVVTNDAEATPVETLVYLPDDSGVAQPFMYAWAGDKQVGVAALRRPMEHGVIYTLGADFLGYPGARCYVNCFDPGRDTLAMFLKGAWREANRGHMLLKHTVPGVQDGVFISSHDVDAPDANEEGSWGEAGAIQMAEMEVEEGVKGTYFITTDIKAGYYAPAMVKGLCKRGMCPQGGHSVQHLDWTALPEGDCAVTEASYDLDAPTVCGEVRVSLQVLRETLGEAAPLLSWRTPLLMMNPRQFPVLAAEGVRYDSSLGLGDVRTNLPFAGHRFPYTGKLFADIEEMWELPVVNEDGIGWFDEHGAEQRLELHSGSWPRFRSGWTDTLIMNAANNAWVVSLVHPSWGVGKGVGPRNLAYKVAANRWAIRLAKRAGMKVMQMTQAGAFWRGRDGVRIEARYDEDIGYSGKIRVGAYEAPGFTLAFGDRIALFVAPGAGPVLVAGKRVVFLDPLPPHALYNFKAVPARGSTSGR